ncbi:MAG TPA: ABC transporter permease [Terriglobales bacterium]|nr:ABC transporter permease [Terriglobales bacterium]
MNTESNAMPESHADAQVLTASTSAPQPLYWSIRRELWENRSIYIAPLAVAGIVLVGFLIGTVHLPERMRTALTLQPMQRLAVIEQPYHMAALMIMGFEFLVALFYCLDALHGERRDRSILFWKSLPVSDLTAVMSKASIPLLVLPLVAFVITVATQWIMLLISTAILLAHGVSVAPLWSEMPWLQLSVMLLYHLVAMHGFWYAPIYGWLLMVSGWARRAVFLWAALPLIAIGVIEKIAFNTSHFGALLRTRILGGPGASDLTASGGVMMHPLTLARLGEFLVSPGLWVGLAITAAFLAAAVQLRRYQGPI